MALPLLEKCVALIEIRLKNIAQVLPELPLEPLLYLANSSYHELGPSGVLMLAARDPILGKELQQEDVFKLQSFLDGTAKPGLDEIIYMPEDLSLELLKYIKKDIIGREEWHYDETGQPTLIMLAHLMMATNASIADLRNKTSQLSLLDNAIQMWSFVSLREEPMEMDLPLILQILIGLFRTTTNAGVLKPDEMPFPCAVLQIDPFNMKKTLSICKTIVDYQMGLSLCITGLGIIKPARLRTVLEPFIELVTKSKRTGKGNALVFAIHTWDATCLILDEVIKSFNIPFGIDVNYLITVAKQHVQAVYDISPCCFRTEMAVRAREVGPHFHDLITQECKGNFEGLPIKPIRSGVGHECNVLEFHRDDLMEYLARLLTKCKGVFLTNNNAIIRQNSQTGMAMRHEPVQDKHFKNSIRICPNLCTEIIPQCGVNSVGLCCIISVSALGFITQEDTARTIRSLLSILHGIFLRYDMTEPKGEYPEAFDQGLFSKNVAICLDGDGAFTEYLKCTSTNVDAAQELERIRHMMMEINARAGKTKARIDEVGQSQPMIEKWGGPSIANAWKRTTSAVQPSGGRILKNDKAAIPGTPFIHNFCHSHLTSGGLITQYALNVLIRCIRMSSDLDLPTEALSLIKSASKKKHKNFSPREKQFFAGIQRACDLPFGAVQEAAMETGRHVSDSVSLFTDAAQTMDSAKALISQAMVLGANETPCLYYYTLPDANTSDFSKKN